MEEQDRTSDSMNLDSEECILPHSPCDESDDDNYPKRNEGCLLEIPTPNYGNEKMDSTTDVEIKEEVGELFMGNEETLQTIFPTGLIIINDQSTLAAGEDVRPGQRQVLTCTSVYNNNKGTPSFLQASEWKCSIIQRSESAKELEVNKSRAQTSEEFVRQFSSEVGEDIIQRDPLVISSSEILNNLSTHTGIPTLAEGPTATNPTREKRYKCTLCLLKFVDPTERNNHIIAVHEDKDSGHLNQPESSILQKRVNCGDCNLTYNDKKGTPSFLQASEWKVQRNKPSTISETTTTSEFIRTIEISKDLSTRGKIHLVTPGTSATIARIGVHEDPVPSNKHLNMTVKKRFNCAHCSKSFRTSWEQNAHEGTHYGRYKCTVCGKEFISKTSLDVHKLRHLEAARSCNKCTEKGCNKSYTKPHDLKRHMLAHSGKKYKCDECENEYINYLTLHNHKKRVHDKNKREHKCEECGKILVSNEALELHMGIHTGEKKYKCLEPECDKTFASWTGLKSHKDSHNTLEDRKRYKCDECENEYLQKDSLMYHQKTVHKSDKREHKCEECGKMLVSVAALELHMGIHTGNKKYKCLAEGCDKTFASPAGFRFHKDSYHAERKHKCDECESGFVRLQDLKNHKEKVHSDSVFQCKLCEKSFTQAQRLTEHCDREHSKPEENRFKCSHCDKTFGNKRDHKRHILIHEKRFKCQKCEETFNSTTKLRSHVIFKHRFDQDVQQTYWQQ